MSDVKIVTNNVPRPVVDAWELTPAERREFDYLDWPAIGEGRDSASFFRFRGELYDLGEFSTTWGLSREHDTRPDWLAGWDGYRPDSYFSGMVVRYADESCEFVVVGRWFSTGRTGSGCTRTVSGD